MAVGSTTAQEVSAESISVAEGELHDEWIEADGAHVLVGRKFSGAGANNSG